MHPNRALAWEDREAMLAFVAEIAFATVVVEGPMLVHVPVLVAGPDRIRFHVSRGNRAKLDDRRAIVSVLGPDAYISPDWYGQEDQVPTWNYLAVEAEGPLRRLDEAELTDLARRPQRRARGQARAQARLDPGEDDAGAVRGDAEGDHRL